MTDLKAANEALAKALAALDSQEHDADVREAEAIRNRLIELDGGSAGASRQSWKRTRPLQRRGARWFKQT